MPRILAISQPQERFGVGAGDLFFDGGGGVEHFELRHRALRIMEWHAGAEQDAIGAEALDELADFVGEERGQQRNLDPVVGWLAGGTAEFRRREAAAVAEDEAARGDGTGERGGVAGGDVGNVDEPTLLTAVLDAEGHRNNQALLGGSADEFQALRAGEFVGVPVGIQAKAAHTELITANGEIVPPAGVGGIENGEGDEAITVVLHLLEHLFVTGVGVAVGDGGGAGDDGFFDAGAVHQAQERSSRVVAELAEGEVAEVGVDVDHARLRARMPAMLSPRILRRAAGSIWAPRRRPALAVMERSVPKRTRLGPRMRTAISTVPSSATLPLVSRKTVGASRRAFTVHSQSPPPQRWAQMRIVSGKRRAASAMWSPSLMLGLGGGEPGGVAGVVEDGDTELGGELEEGADDGVGDEIVVVDFDADEAFVFDVVADLFEGAGAVAGIDEAVAGDFVGELFGDAGEGAVGFAEAIEGDGAFGGEDGAAELVDAEFGGGVDEHTVGIDGAGFEAERKVGMSVDDARGRGLGEGGGGKQGCAEAAAGGEGGSHPALQGM
jgi:hypothetical protein